MAFQRKLVIPIIGDSRSFERAIKRSIGASHRFDSRMGRMGKIAALGLAGVASAATGLGVALGVQAVRAAATFEMSLSRIVGLAGQSQKQVKAWGNQLISLGPRLGKSPQELAEALYFIASSGVPASKAIGALVQSAKASSAGLGETQVVADAVTSVMNAYASSNMTAAHATDVLVATVREGKGEADEFAGVIGNVAAFASRLKVPFEQVGAALAAMTQLGTDPRTAATQLSAFFSSVLKVGPAVQKKADAIGFSFANLTAMLARGDLRGSLKYISGFAATHGGVTALAPMFPNIRALRALLAIAPGGKAGDKVAGVFNRMANSAGSARKAFAAAAKTSQHSFEVFGAAISALKIAFGQGLLPIVNKLALQLGRKFMDPKFVNQFRQAGQQLGAALMTLGAWLQANWPAINKMFHDTARTISAIAGAANWITKHKGPSGMDILHKVTGAPGAIGGALGGGGMHIHGDVHVNGVQDPKDMYEKIVRHSKKKSPKTRGQRSPGLYHH